MKTDDDTFVNVPNLIHILLGGTMPLYDVTKDVFNEDAADPLSSNNRLTNFTDLLFGCLYTNVRAIRDSDNKWYDHFELYDSRGD